MAHRTLRTNYQRLHRRWKLAGFLWIDKNQTISEQFQKYQNQIQGELAESSLFTQVLLEFCQQGHVFSEKTAIIKQFSE